VVQRLGSKPRLRHSLRAEAPLALRAEAPLALRAEAPLARVRQPRSGRALSDDHSHKERR